MKWIIVTLFLCNPAHATTIVCSDEAATDMLITEYIQGGVPAFRKTLQFFTVPNLFKRKPVCAFYEGETGKPELTISKDKDVLFIKIH